MGYRCVTGGVISRVTVAGKSKARKNRKWQIRSWRRLEDNSTENILQRKPTERAWTAEEKGRDQGKRRKEDDYRWTYRQNEDRYK